MYINGAALIWNIKELTLVMFRRPSCDRYIIQRVKLVWTLNAQHVRCTSYFIYLLEKFKANISLVFEHRIVTAILVALLFNDKITKNYKIQKKKQKM